MKLLALLLVASTTAFAQVADVTNRKTEPKEGKAALQLVYYRIDFTKEETEYLRNHSAELIFSVSQQGNAKLEKVNDIEMHSIVDSMMNVNDRLPEFYPELVNGQAQVGVYFLKLAWPNYQSQLGLNPMYQGLNSPYQYQQFYNPTMRKLNEFEEITYRRTRYDMLIGFFGTHLSGNIAAYLNDGWGTKFDFMIYGKNGWGGGFLSTIIIGKQEKYSSSQPIRTQTGGRLLTLFSGAFGKLFRETSAGQFSLQVEPSIGMTSATFGTDSQLGWGFSPGVTAVYMMPLGKGRMTRQYFLPVVYKQYLSFHLAARKLMFNIPQASGNVYEFGVSYRLATKPVANYKLKN